MDIQVKHNPRRSRESGEQPLPEVLITPNGSGFRYRFAYDEIEHEDGRHELRCLEAGVVQLRDRVREIPLEERVPINATIAGDFQRQWERYEQVARVALEVHFGGENFTRAPRTRRVLSDEFLTKIVKRHRELKDEGYSPTETLAREERVGSSTVRMWLAKARERGIEAS
jgi:hypothetical protein